MDDGPDRDNKVGEPGSDERPWQFSLRALFVVTAVVAVLCSIFASIPLAFIILFFILLTATWDMIILPAWAIGKLVAGRRRK